MRRRSVAIAITGALALLAAAATALADSRMAVSGGVLYFRSEDAGVSNTLVVDNDSRNRAHFVDDADPAGISYPTPPCSPGRLNGTGNTVEVFCTKTNYTKITVQTGPGEDQVTYKLDDLPATLEGAVGADTLTGAGAADGLYGGQGNDTLDGGAGNDTFKGDEGDDTIKGGDGNDNIDGGIGADTIDAGPGDDAVRSADGIVDKLDCGAGTDTVDADTRDRITNCENITRRDVAAPSDQPSANDKTRPVVQAGGLTSQRVSRRRRTVSVAVSVSEKGLVNVSGFLDAGGINDRLKPISGRISVGGGGKLIKIRLSKTQVRRVLADLRRHRKARLRLTISAVDQAGNTSRPRHLTISLRR